MNIAEFVKSIMPHVSQCTGKCVEFGSILINNRAGISSYRLTESNKCCTIVFIEGIKILNGYTTKVLAGREVKMKDHCDFVFNILLLDSADYGTQDHQEVDHDKPDESRWVEHIEPKLNCLGCGYEPDICSLIGPQYYITKWNVIPEHRVSNNELDGVRIEVSIRKFI